MFRVQAVVPRHLPVAEAAHRYDGHTRMACAKKRDPSSLSSSSSSSSSPSRPLPPTSYAGLKQPGGACINLGTHRMLERHFRILQHSNGLVVRHASKGYCTCTQITRVMERKETAITLWEPCHTCSVGTKRWHASRCDTLFITLASSLSCICSALFFHWSMCLNAIDKNPNNETPVIPASRLTHR